HSGAHRDPHFSLHDALPISPKTHPKLDALVRYAINYYRDFVLPTKRFREPTESERVALTDLRDALARLPDDASAEDIQNVVYEIDRKSTRLNSSHSQISYAV